MKILDSEGTDIWPLVQHYAAENGIPPVLLLACGQAESNWRRTAARYGVWPDVSCGCMQFTVQTAGAYGIGDGTPASIDAVCEALFDLETSIRLGARHLAGSWAGAQAYPEPDLQCLIRYNSGGYHPRGDWWWQRWGANARRYEDCLQWAREQLGEA